MHADPDHRPPTDDALLLRALGEVSAQERVAIDRAILADAQVRARYERMAQHLALWDAAGTTERALPEARLEAGDAPGRHALPQPPPFQELEGRLDLHLARRRAGTARPTGLRWPAAGRVAAVAAVVILTLGVLALWPETTRNPAQPTRGTAHNRPSGSGGGSAPAALLAGTRPPRATLPDGRRLLTVHEAQGAVRPEADPQAALRAGTRLVAHHTASYQLGRARMVLEQGAELALISLTEVRLETGRVWFDVEPGPFHIDTPGGPVRVLGTSFSVAVPTPAAPPIVEVQHGRVAVGDQQVTAGQRLAGGRLAVLEDDPQRWFARPRLTARHLAAAQPAREAAEGERAGRGTLELVLENPTGLVLALHHPGTGRAPLWLRITAPDGGVVDHAIRQGEGLSAGRLPGPGDALILGPGERRTWRVRIPAMADPAAPAAAPRTGVGRWRVQAQIRTHLEARTELGVTLGATAAPAAGDADAPPPVFLRSPPVWIEVH